MRLTKSVATASITLILAGCSAVQSSPMTSTSPSVAIVATPTPEPTASPKPTAIPTPTPSPTPDPAVGLSVSELSYSPNTCYTDVRDAEGHVLHGGIVTFAVTVTNKAAHKSVPIWLRVRPDDRLPSSPMAVEGSVGKSVDLAGQSSGFGGTTVPAKGKAVLKWRVFFEAPYVVHYQPTLRYGDPDADAGVEWDHAFTTINVC